MRLPSPTIYLEAKMTQSPRRPSRPLRRTTLPRELQHVNLNAAGVDIGAEAHFAAVPAGRDPQRRDVRQFGAFTADL